MCAQRRTFAHAGDVEKHFVRRKLWLPTCRDQKKAVHSGSSKNQRRLRYFTFCAEDAVDVLLLEQHKVIQTVNGQYSDVCFAALEDEDLAYTQRTIPGAVGFSGDFFENVLFEAQGQRPSVGAPHTSSSADDDFYATLAEAEESVLGRKDLLVPDLQRMLEPTFPFDFINLDLCGFVFRKKQPTPGNIVNAIRQVLQWQLNEHSSGPVPYRIDRFVFLLTMRIDEAQALGPNYESMLDTAIDENTGTFSELGTLLADRFNVTTASALRSSDRTSYLRIATAKLFLATIHESDWEPIPGNALRWIEIRRAKPKTLGEFGMLHMAVHVQRKSLGRNRRSPTSSVAATGYREAARIVFGAPVDTVTRKEANVGEVRDDVAGLLRRGQQNRSRANG